MKYFSMFSGIGGFEYGLQQSEHNFECVGYSEIDKYAASIYERNYPGHTNYGDATQINTKKLPEFDLLVAGFPCQSFSIAGNRKGFDDTRGTMFFEIARFLKDKIPRYILFENVKGLLSHDRGKTIQTIFKVLNELRYDVSWSIYNSKDYGVPQNRERIFIKGYLRGQCGSEVLHQTGNRQETDGRLMPLNKNPQAQKVYDPNGLSCTLSANGGGQGGKTGLYKIDDDREIKVIGNLSPSGHGGSNVYSSDGISPCLLASSLHKNGLKIVSTINPPIIEKCYGSLQKNHAETDGSYTPTLTSAMGCGGGHTPMLKFKNDFRIRRLTPRECERLQGFPDDWTKYGSDGKQISDTQRYKCLGNAVTTNVVTAVINEMFQDVET